MFRNTDSISTDSVSTEDLEHDTWQRSGLRQVRRHSLTASRIRRLDLIDCGNWADSISWRVPSEAVSGIYFAKLIREDCIVGASHVIFIVRDDENSSDVLFQTSDTTWQAYNANGGRSLYDNVPPGASRTSKVSYNRPFTNAWTNSENWVFYTEYPMVRWLESNGYVVSYFSGVDTDRYGHMIRTHKSFLSVGHDE